KGETLAALARRYHTQPHVIRQLNDLGDGPLVAGTDLRVPSGATALPAKVRRAAALVDGGGRQVRPASVRPRIHVVRRGESLWKISRRTGVDLKTLATLNGLGPNAKLRAGDRIVIAAASGAGRERSAANGGRGGSSGVVHYTVRHGDTLYGISRLYNVTVAQLRAWNRLPNSATIKIGQKLIVFLPQRR
ncbi:MAG: LysM peptidoglycan-binding domain-containing protein, partial [Steroidobacteraceae bacterium]|nr:LysM peptidoglycan-binding domain-containing protein [Steroidobacteraceae bacterium]MDW8259480.1 LysM peptidoglycan-binding domain-containing protein [Gammaproteobacteria bacterium]